MTTPNNIILNQLQISQKIRRIAYQIYETNSSEKEVILAGIVGNGFVFAKKLEEVLLEISPLKIRVHQHYTSTIFCCCCFYGIEH